MLCVEYCKQHIFLVLTKRPLRIHSVLYGQEGTFWLGGGDYLSNVWLGTTVENQEQAKIRIPHLLKCLPFRLWLSVEPMLDKIDLCPYLDTYSRRLNWVVCGCESGPNARLTSLDWIRALRNQCIDAQVPFFLKQMRIDGKLVKMPKLDSRKWQELPFNLGEAGRN